MLQPSPRIGRHAAMSPLRRAAVAALIVATTSSTAPSAFAQDASPQSAAVVAEALFDEAVALMQAQRFAEACPKLAESHRLDPASGTVFNLAICLEKEGKHASAAIAFEESVARSIKDGNKERESLARERLAQIKPLVSKIVVRVDAKIAGLEGLDVRFDGASVRHQAWGIQVPMDLGVHTLTAVASGKKELRREVDIAETGKVYEVTIDALDDAPIDPTARSASGPLRPVDEGGTRRTVGWGLVGLGGLFVVGGGISGVIAIDRHAESDRLCKDPPGCTPEGVSAETSANRFAWGANIGIGLGLVSAAVGAVLLFTQKPSSGRAGTAGRPAWITF